MVRLECTTSGHNKFYEIASPALVDARWVVRVQYGRIGRGRKSHNYIERDEWSARQKYDALIRQKTGKGYVMMVPPPLYRSPASYRTRPGPTTAPPQRASCDHANLTRVSDGKWRCRGCHETIEFGKTMVSDMPELREVGNVRRYFSIRRSA